jgi:hypothetical protein
MTEVEKTRMAMLDGCIDHHTSFDDVCRIVKMTDDTLEMDKARLRDACKDLIEATGLLRLFRRVIRV